MQYALFWSPKSMPTVVFAGVLVDSLRRGFVASAELVVLFLAVRENS
jgi:hypothetical protein